MRLLLTGTGSDGEKGKGVMALDCEQSFGCETLQLPTSSASGYDHASCVCPASVFFFLGPLHYWNI